jgi:hypothetical protein
MLLKICHWIHVKEISDYIVLMTYNSFYKIITHFFYFMMEYCATSFKLHDAAKTALKGKWNLVFQIYLFIYLRKRPWH